MDAGLIPCASFRCGGSGRCRCLACLRFDRMVLVLDWVGAFVGGPGLAGVGSTVGWGFYFGLGLGAGPLFYGVWTLS